MTYFPHQTPQPGSRVTEIVADVLATGVLILAGIITVVQFAYY